MTKHKDTLFTHNRVEDSQRFYIENNDNMELVHSKHSDNRMANITESILDEKTGKGKGSKSEHNVCSVSMLQSSFDISVKSAVLTLSHPNTIAQYFGRIDRHGTKPDGIVTITPEKNKNIFSYDKKGFRKVYEKYEEYMNTCLETPKKLTHREATIIFWDDFVNKEEIIDLAYQEMEDKLKDACQSLSRDGYPKKYPNNTKNNKSFSGKSLFRGCSVLVAAEEYDDYGTCLGMTDVNELLTVSSDWEIKRLQKAFMEISKPSLKNNLNKFGFESGNYPINLPSDKNWKEKKHKFVHGRHKETPYYYSHTDSNLKGKLSHKLGNHYMVYNKNLGLVKWSIYKDFANRNNSNKKK